MLILLAAKMEGDLGGGAGNHLTTIRGPREVSPMADQYLFAKF